MAVRLITKLQLNFKISVNDVFKLRTPAKIAEIAKFVKGSLRSKLEQIKLIYKKLENIREKDLTEGKTKKERALAAGINRLGSKYSFKKDK